MTIWLINILFMCLPSLFHHFHQQHDEERSNRVHRIADTVTNLFYHQARFSGWFSKPVPHLFVEVGTGGEITGWVGYEFFENKRPFKSCWRLVFNKTGENAYTATWGDYDYHITKAEFRKILLRKENGKWLFSILGENGTYEVRPFKETPVGAKVLRALYSEASFTTLRFLVNDSYGYKNDTGPGKRNLMDSLYAELPFDHYRNVVNGLPVNKLAAHLGYLNNLPSPYPYADTLIYSQNTNGHVKTSKLYGAKSSVFYKMLQAAVLTGPVSNFSPSLVITRKNYHSLDLSKNEKLWNNEVIYQFKDNILFVDGYWLRLDRSVTTEIVQLFNIQQKQ